MFDPSPLLHEISPLSNHDPLLLFHIGSHSLENNKLISIHKTLCCPPLNRAPTSAVRIRGSRGEEAVQRRVPFYPRLCDQDKAAAQVPPLQLLGHGQLPPGDQHVWPTGQIRVQNLTSTRGSRREPGQRCRKRLRRPYTRSHLLP